MLKSSVDYVGGTPTMPDYIYYNAEIINNETNDGTANAGGDPTVRFNETRDTALVKDASQYHFSIVRFTMNGCGLDLPLFIPSIQSGTGQTDPNKTAYEMAIAWSGKIVTAETPAGFTVPTVAPPVRAVTYTPETQNPTAAPIPLAPSNPNFVGVAFNPEVTGGLQPSAVAYSPTPANYYAVNPAAPWSSTTFYPAGAWVQFGTLAYYATAASPAGTVPSSGAPWVVGTPAATAPSTIPNVWSLVGPNYQPRSQDLSSRYYWVYTIQHWVDLINGTFYAAWNDTYTAVAAALAAAGQTNPFTAFDDGSATSWIQSVGAPPQLNYDPTTKLFTLALDSRTFPAAYGPPVVPSTPPVGAVAVTDAAARLFFDTNMYGLFANFDNFYWNTATVGARTFSNGVVSPTFAAPSGYVNEILCVNKNYTNLLDTTGLAGTPVNYKAIWIQNVQDWLSTSNLWSPISSIVFCSTLLPVRAEQTGPPNKLGSSDLGQSSNTAQSAFQPIITDIAIDTSASGSPANKTFIVYTPSAEYRMADFGVSKQEVRNIDVQVFWKNRLDSQLYPIQMFNLSSVSFKMMLRHRLAK